MDNSNKAGNFDFTQYLMKQENQVKMNLNLRRIKPSFIMEFIKLFYKSKV